MEALGIIVKQQKGGIVWALFMGGSNPNILIRQKIECQALTPWLLPIIDPTNLLIFDHVFMRIIFRISKIGK